jgi:hypothetical protein
LDGQSCLTDAAGAAYRSDAQCGASILVVGGVGGAYQQQFVEQRQLGVAAGEQRHVGGKLRWLDRNSRGPREFAACRASEVTSGGRDKPAPVVVAVGQHLDQRPHRGAARAADPS